MLDGLTIRYRMLKEAVKHRIMLDNLNGLKKDAAIANPEQIALIIDDLSRRIAKAVIQQKLKEGLGIEDIQRNGLFIMTQSEMNNFINSVVNERPKAVVSTLIPPSEELVTQPKEEKPKSKKKID